MQRLIFLCLALWSARGADLSLDLRTRVELFKGSNDWQEVHSQKTFPAGQTAILICDMWDDHWCKGASRRVGVLADKMDPVLAQARKLGILIIHSPSETMDFYQDTPQRKLMLALERVEPPPALGLSDPVLPIDDKAGGCDTHDSFRKA